MKKSVQALLNRRRARLAQTIFAAMTGLVLFALVALTYQFFTAGPGAQILATFTPTPTPTLTPSLTPTISPPTPTVPTATPTVTEGPSPTPAPVTYTVSAGDTLFGIADRFQVNLESIKLANNLTSDALSVGQTLIIPLGGVPTLTPTPLPTGLGRGARIEYVVELGDTLEVIAAKFNSTVEDIQRRNDNITNDKLQVGQVLAVRINLVTPTPTPAATPTP